MATSNSTPGSQSGNSRRNSNTGSINLSQMTLDSPRTIKTTEARRIGSIKYDVTGHHLPPKTRAQFHKTLTPLGKKYGTPHGIDHADASNHRVLISPTTPNHTPHLRHSGITPTFPPPLDPNDPNYPTLSRKRKRIERYQRTRFYGWTMSELHALDILEALTPDSEMDGVQRGNGGYIHPIFDKSQWLSEKNRKFYPRTRGAVPLLGGHEGCWVADNPIVWNIMKPVLLLATKMLQAEFHSDWLDTLIFGKVEQIGEWTDKTGRKQARKRVMPRTPDERLAVNKSREIIEWVANLTGTYNYSFASGSDITPFVLPWLDGVQAFKKGVTTGWVKRSYVRVTLEEYQALLELNLTQAERLGLEFKAATTLVHETGHIMWRARRAENLQDPLYLGNEPFFGLEPLNEIGFSLTEHLWGGYNHPFQAPTYYKGGPGTPQLGMVRTSYFQVRNSNYSSAGSVPSQHVPTPPGTVDPFLIRDNYPVPTTYTRSLLLPQTWNRALKFGIKSLHMGPIKYGYRIHDKITNTDSEKFDPWKEKRGDWRAVVVRGDMTVEEGAEAAREHGRIVRGEGIREDLLRKGVVRSPAVSGVGSDGGSGGAIGGSDKGSDDDDDDDDDTSSESADDLDPGPEPWKPTYECPRYEEIKAYLLKNKGWDRLALDTMKLVTEPQLYRYIRDHNSRQKPGGSNNELKITGLEFRAFLAVASEKEELFVWEPYPGPGMIYRLDVAWGPPSPIPHLPTLADTDDEQELKILDNLMGDPKVQERLYTNVTSENSDLDIVAFKNSLENSGNLEYDLQWLWDVCCQLTRRKSKNICIGPLGVVRFLFDVTKYRAKSTNTMLKTSIKRMEKAARDRKARAVSQGRV